MKEVVVADSCACGMCVLFEIMKCSANLRLTYLADGERNPFGLRTRDQIQDIVDDWLRYSTGRDRRLDALVVACNTASSAMEPIRRELSEKWRIPIVTMLDGLTECIDESISTVRGRPVSLFGTEFTCLSGDYDRVLLRAGAARVHHIVGTRTERLVARGLGDTESAVSAARDEIVDQRDTEAKAVVLGCTCFTMITPMLKDIFGPDVVLLDPSEHVAKTLMAIAEIPSERILGESELQVYASGDLSKWSRRINRVTEELMGRRVEVKRVILR